jgi:hypothetical protein
MANSLQNCMSLMSSEMVVIIIHLLGQPHAGWLTASGIQPEGRMGMKPNIAVNQAPASA